MGVPILKASHRIIVFGISVALFTTVAGLIICEILVRGFNIGPEISAVRSGNFQLSKNPILRYELAPNTPDGSFAISDAGLRDRHYSLEKPDNTFRIAFLGDSIAYGFGVDQTETTSAHLERLLNKYYPDAGFSFEVLNFGVPGYNFQQIFETLRVKALLYSLDLIIYAYCLNDPQEYSYEMAKLQAGTVAATNVLEVIPLYRSRLFMLARYAITRPKWNRDDPQAIALSKGNYAQYFSQLHRDPARWGPIQSGLDELRDISLTRGVPVLVLIIPVLKDLENYPIKSVSALLHRAFADRSLHVLDLLEFYASYEQEENRRIGWDSLHLTAEGHAFTAVATLYKLLDESLIPGLMSRDVSKVLAESNDEQRYAQIVRDVFGER